MAIAPVVFAFFSGVGYLCLQALFLSKMVVLCDHPRTALAVHYYLLFITILVASYIVEARPSKTPERWLRVTGLAIVITHAAAFFALHWWRPGNFSALASAGIGGALLTAPAIAAGVAFGKYVQLVQLAHPRSIFTVLCSIAVGALIAAPRAKFLVTLIGAPPAFAITLLAFVAILTILPAPADEDRHPSPW